MLLYVKEGLFPFMQVFYSKLYRKDSYYKLQVGGKAAKLFYIAMLVNSIFCCLNILYYQHLTVLSASDGADFIYQNLTMLSASDGTDFIYQHLTVLTISISI